MPRTKVDIPKTLYRKFNDWVRGELKRRHQTQNSLAEYLNISRSSLTLRLLGQVEWSFLEVLNTMEYFGVDIAEIL